MDVVGVLLASLVLVCLAAMCYANVSFSSLQETLAVTASPKEGQLLKVGEDQIKITWSFNNTFPSGTDSAYKTVKLKLCYAPISQEDRAWRKTEDNLSKDKTCQHAIASRPYNPSNNTFVWRIEREVPTATYFIRAYVLNSPGSEVAFGQTTNAKKTTNLFQVQGITGLHVTLDICSVCFSAFSVVALFAFFFMDRRKLNAAQQK